MDIACYQKCMVSFAKLLTKEFFFPCASPFSDLILQKHSYLKFLGVIDQTLKSNIYAIFFKTDERKAKISVNYDILYLIHLYNILFLSKTDQKCSLVTLREFYVKLKVMLCTKWKEK